MLLKTEGLKSDNAEKYLEVIDRKSIRLKNLTEDLVEASKLNAGAINFEMQQIDIVQLVNQSLGEYEEKFEEKHLTVMKTIQEKHGECLKIYTEIFINMQWITQEFMWI